MGKYISIAVLLVSGVAFGGGYGNFDNSSTTRNTYDYGNGFSTSREYDQYGNERSYSTYGEGNMSRSYSNDVYNNHDSNRDDNNNNIGGTRNMFRDMNELRKGESVYGHYGR